MTVSIAQRRALKSIAVALVGVGATGAALSCTLRHQLVMADGQRACLTDFPIANEHVTGTVTSVATVAPNSFVYSIAISTPSDSCPKVLVMEWAQWGKHTIQMRDDISAVRSAQAKRKCEAQARTTGQPSCSCEVVLEDGNSTLTAAQLASRLAPQSGVQK